MATKAQIARKLYGTALSNLSGGQKAAVTRAFDKQELASPVVKKTAVKNVSPTGYIEATFGRPGFNGTKSSLVKIGTTMREALDQTGFVINPKKEGVIRKSDGKVILYTDAAEEVTYMIVPGVDSSN